MVEVIPLKYGVTFKRVFSEPEIFCAFVQDALGIEVKVNKVYTEYEYPEAVGYVKIKYDLFAEDTDRRIIVEIQHIKQDNFFDRFLYYHLLGLIEQARTYQGYQFGRTVYTIVVLTSIPEDGSVAFSVGEMDLSVLTEFGTRVNPYRHRLLFLSPRQVNPQTPEKIKPWLELIKDSLDTQVDEQIYPSPMFQRVIKTIQKNTITPDELAHIKDEESWEISQIKAKAEGREEGREEGKKEGLVEGRNEGAESTLRQLLPMMAQFRFGDKLPADLVLRLQQFNLARLQQLQNTIQSRATVEEWLA